MGFLRWLIDAIGQAVVGGLLVAIMTTIAPVWAFFSNAPGYIIFTVALVALAASIFIVTKVLSLIIKRNNPASLSLQIFGDERSPIRISDVNIWRWYWFRNIAIHVSNGSHQRETLSTILFLCFDRPARVGTLNVRSPDIQLPLFEVKQFFERFAIIVFTGAVPAGTLEISVT